MTSKTLIKMLTITIIAAALFLSSCAGGPDAESQIKTANEMRTFERFKSDHELSSGEKPDSAGIYYDGKYFFVVISLTDSGTDRFPEWACDRFTQSLYGYRAVDQKMVSDNEFYELALRFTLEEIIEGKYENLAIISVKEKDIEEFLKVYKEDN